MCAIDSESVGVDVQQICLRTDLDIAERFFAPAEAEQLRSLPVEQQREGFFELWALKESYIKAEGRGLSIPLDSFAFAFELQNNRQPTAITLCCPDATQAWQFRLFDFDRGYKLALCLNHSDFPSAIDYFDEVDYGKF